MWEYVKSVGSVKVISNKIGTAQEKLINMKYWSDCYWYGVKFEYLKVKPVISQILKEKRDMLLTSQQILTWNHMKS